jgi:hypothetical protein
MLQPVAHSLLQARADVERVTRGVTGDRLWARLGDAAPAAFHLRHLAGSLDRLLTYARGESLTDDQRAYLALEGSRIDAATEPPDIIESVLVAIDRAMDQVAGTPESELLEARFVGARRLPSNVLGLLFHAAEHTTRHVGQLITTLRAAPAGPSEERSAG